LKKDNDTKKESGIEEFLCGRHSKKEIRVVFEEKGRRQSPVDREKRMTLVKMIGIGGKELVRRIKGLGYKSKSKK